MGANAEVRAAGRLVGDVLAGGVGFVEGMHRGIAGRAFGGVGPLGRPVRLVHDAIAGTVYGAVRRAHAVAPRAGATVLAGRVPGDAAGVHGAPVGRATIAAVNGLWGDALARRHPAFAVSMSVQHRGRAIEVEEQALAAAFPRATGRVAVFVHGLCENAESWRRATSGEGREPAPPYGTRLRQDLGYTPVYVTYNSGLRISDNGRELAQLLDELVARWPVPVDEVVLVGHSMGGLVARSACHDAGTAGRRWADLVRHVFCLGTPHLGAPLERGVNVASWLLDQLPETRPLAGVLKSRSVGVKDLRFGACVEEDWSGHDPDELLRDRCTEVPFLPDAAYYFVGATLTGDPDHPLGALVGDLLVQLPSASGRGRRRRVPFEVERGHRIGGLTHFDLLNHPAVYEQLHRWLAAVPVAA